MTRFDLHPRLIAVSILLSLLTACDHHSATFPGDHATPPAFIADVLTDYTLTGNTHRVLDPSIIRQGKTYYLFSTDVVASSAAEHLVIRCSKDESSWTQCGAVFQQIPGWVRAKIPGVRALWAPDISYFDGLYHVYYAASLLGSQRSVIGLATNTTLDSEDPAYKWVDQGEVLASYPGDDFNAIDPNILVDSDGSVYLTYGSYWTGIKQFSLDFTTGLPLPHAKRVSLATRPYVPNNPIEGPSLVRHGSFYYLFVSIDYCCNADPAANNYKQTVGRSTSPQGPFTDMNNTSMMSGGGTVLIEGDSTWHAPGGGTMQVDSENDESILVFHALNMTEKGTQYLWLKHVTWQNDWPTLQ